MISRLRRDPLSALQTPVGFTVVLLLVVWLVFPLLPEGSGLQFGAGYQLFFSGIVVAAGLFFWLLGLGPIAQPRGSLRIVSSIALVYVVTVGALVAAGNSYLQFSIPSADGQVLAELSPAELGERLFWNTPPGCFLCHSIGGRGGQRAPDMAGLATRAGTRVPGVAAEEYIDGHIRQGLNYPYTVPEYAPIMPPYGSSLSDAEIAALVTYLMSLE